jgi:glycosyltransferase involved in cell wall biosynthesis
MKANRFSSLLLPKTEKQLYISFPTEKRIREILVEEKIDILHNIIPTPSSAIATRVAKALGIRVVTHSHSQPENIFLHFPKVMPKEALNKAYYKFMYWLYNQADAIIYPTEFAKKLFPGLDEKLRTEVISNGVDTKHFQPVPTDPFRERFGLDQGKKHILFVGRFHPEKSIDTLIKAAPLIVEKCPEAHITLVGFGHQEEKMKRLAEKLAVEKHITFCGKVSDEELVMAYSLADLFVLPSLAELEGMVVLEAMACGIPILIAEAKNSASVFFVDGNGYLFGACDHVDLAEKAVAILSDDKLRAEMAAKSLEKSRSYDIERSIDHLEELYYSLVDL